MNNTATLTIGIPTYNGAQYIRSTLDSVIKQISGDIGERVDILISDNASSDDTPVIISSYIEAKSARIRYSRNDNNLGFDRNVDMLFKKAIGQYVWILGDDDVLEDGALPYVMRLLDQNRQLKAIQVNFDKYDKTLERVVQQVSIPSDKYCRDAETFLFNSKGRWGAISSLIIDQDAWNDEDLSTAFGSQVIFGYALFKILLRGDSYIVKQPLVKVRDGSEKAVKNGDGDARLMIAFASGTLYHAMKQMGYSNKIIRWYLREDRRYAYDAIPLAKMWGIKDKMAVTRKLIEIHNSPTLWLKWIPLIFFPDTAFRVLYLLKKGISSKTRPIEQRLKPYLKKLIFWARNPPKLK